jgi:phosphate-selective porin OprO/OprP
MLHGKLNEKQFEYAVSAAYGQLAGLADTNNTREAIGYINFLPFLHSPSRSYLRHLNLGGSLALGRQPYAEGNLPLRTSLQSSENDEAAAAASSVFLEFNNDVVSAGKRLQGALHASLYTGPISVEAEWYAAEFNMAPNALSVTTPVNIMGYDVTVASFLTGERITERSQVAPLRPFTGWGRGGRGALEVFGRYSELSLSDNVFTGGLAEEADWTNRVSMTDIGYNWYLNRSFRITFDWQHVMYGSPVLLNEAEGLRRSSNDLLWTRFQLYF